MYSVLRLAHLTWNFIDKKIKGSLKSFQLPLIFFREASQLVTELPRIKKNKNQKHLPAIFSFVILYCVSREIRKKSKN